MLVWYFPLKVLHHCSKPRILVVQMYSKCQLLLYSWPLTGKIINKCCLLLTTRLLVSGTLSSSGLMFMFLISHAWLWSADKNYIPKVILIVQNRVSTKYTCHFMFTTLNSVKLQNLFLLGWCYYFCKNKNKIKREIIFDWKKEKIFCKIALDNLGVNC